MKVGIVLPQSSDSYWISKTYINYVYSNYNTPVLITDSGQVKDVDSILIPGGSDIDPTIFGEDNYASIKPYATGDVIIVDIIKEAVNQGKNIFGICKGFQILSYMYLIPKYPNNVYYMQHVDGHNQTKNLDVPRNSLFHSVYDKNGARHFVNSMHHQAVACDLKFSAPEITFVTSFGANKNEKIIEGFSMKVGNSIIDSVQWHPEELI